MNDLSPQRSGTLGIDVPDDSQAIKDHAAKLLRGRGMNCTEVAAVHSAGSPGAVGKCDTILYVNSRNETRHALVWRDGSNNRTLKVRTFADWPVRDLA